MIAVAFSAMVILALISSAIYFVMRIRLMRADSAINRIEWLSFRNTDDVLAAYEALFPSSMLPRFCRFVFWTLIAFAAIGLCAILVLKTSGR